MYYPGVVNDNLYYKCSITQYNILYAIEMCLLIFLPCSHSIIPTNETCLVTCAVSLICATWLMYKQLSFDLPLNQDTSLYTYILYLMFVLYIFVCMCVHVYIGTLHL